MVVAPKPLGRPQGCRDGAKADRIRLTGSLRHFSFSWQYADSTHEVVRAALRLAVGRAARSLATLAAQPQAPGQIRPRPAEGREPELPSPTIRQYKPRSTLVVPQHPVPRAKFPVVDLHGHPPALTGPDVVEPRRRRHGSAERAGDGERQRHVAENGCGSLSQRSTPADTRTGWSCSPQINVRDLAPGGGRGLPSSSKRTSRPGALGLGEIMKDFGMRARKAMAAG